MPGTGLQCTVRAAGLNAVYKYFALTVDYLRTYRGMLFRTAALRLRRMRGIPTALMSTAAPPPSRSRVDWTARPSPTSRELATALDRGQYTDVWREYTLARERGVKLWPATYQRLLQVRCDSV